MQNDTRYSTFSEQTACIALREAGLDMLPEQVHVEMRDGRWLVTLPAGQLAWFPMNDPGAKRLQIERRVLRLLQERCSFRVPLVLFESAQGWDVRAAVPGICDPWGLYQRLLSDTHLARCLGQAIGLILVEQHTRILEADVSGWLATKPDWPEPSERLRVRLPNVIDDRGLVADIDETLDAFDAVTVSSDDHVLVHGDLGLHNVAVDSKTSEVLGVFDYGGASWADRHYDLRYLIFDIGIEEALEAALEVYERAIGRMLNRYRIRLYNAACAIGFLAFREGVPPDQRWCGRTLAEDLNWVRTALARL
jgi:hypothetical protein